MIDDINGTFAFIHDAKQVGVFSINILLYKDYNLSILSIEYCLFLQKCLYIFSQNSAIKNRQLSETIYFVNSVN